MTEQRNDGHDDRLETRYREAGGVEPESGLDRIICARADEAIRTQRSSNRMPWLGGLVTASVAIVAIAVLIQQTPPGERLPESLAPPATDKPDAFMAPSMGARPQQEVSADAIGEMRESRAEEASAKRSSRTQMPETLTQATHDVPQPIMAEPEADAAAPQPRPEDATLDRTLVTGSRLRSSATKSAALESVDAVVEELRELIKAERIEAARDLRKHAIELHPEIEFPEDIEQALREPDTINPGFNRD